jgi:steroid delta-isomerase-like uncharacterized protein
VALGVAIYWRAPLAGLGLLLVAGFHARACDSREPKAISPGEWSMNAAEAVAVAERIVETWNAQDLPSFFGLLTEDVWWDDPAMPAPAAGADAVRRFIETVLRAFPDFHVAIRPPICVALDGSRCALPWRITGTHVAPLDPPGWAPTNRRAEFDGVDLLEFRGGKVCRITTLFNPVEPASQLLGLTQRPAPGSMQERLVVGLQRLLAAWRRSAPTG